MTRRSDQQAAATREPEIPSDPAEAIDHAMQVLFGSCLALCRATRTTETDKDQLIHSAIAGVDESIRVLRSTASALL